MTNIYSNEHFRNTNRYAITLHLPRRGPGPFDSLHDAWVTRDRLGRLVSSLWPYLLEDDGMASITSDQPAPVFTCWNGIVSFRSEPFLPPHLRPSNSVLSKTPVPETRREGRVPSSHPWYGRVVGGGSKKEGKGVVGGEGQEAVSPREMPQLRFRASGRKECFGSESFNLPYDMRRVFDLQCVSFFPFVFLPSSSSLTTIGAGLKLCLLGRST